MKLKNNNPHDHSEQNGLKHVPRKVKEYVQSVYTSLKMKKMSCGSCNIVRMMSWAHNENWRRNAQRSLNKKHHK